MNFKTIYMLIIAIPFAIASTSAQQLTIESYSPRIDYPERLIDTNETTFIQEWYDSEVIIDLNGVYKVNHVDFINTSYPGNFRCNVYQSLDNVSYSFMGTVTSETDNRVMMWGNDIRYVKVVFSGYLELREMYVDVQMSNYEFSHDAAGNRISRVLVLKSAKGESFLDSEKEVNKDLLPQNYLADYLAGHNLKIYPNPTRGELALEFENFPEDKSIKLSVYNMSGKLITEKTMSNKFYVLDINNEPKGNYILKLTLGDSQKTFQIVKQ